MKRILEKIKVQDVKLGMRIKFSGEMAVSGLDVLQDHEGEVSWLQKDGENMFITVFLMNRDYGHDFACVSIEARKDDTIYEMSN